MTLKCTVITPHFRYQQRVCEDPYLVQMQIWWYQLKSLTSYCADTVKFTGGQTTRRAGPARDDAQHTDSDFDEWTISIEIIYHTNIFCYKEYIVLHDCVGHRYGNCYHDPETWSAVWKSMNARRNLLLVSEKENANSSDSDCVHLVLNAHNHCHLS